MSHIYKNDTMLVCYLLRASVVSVCVSVGILSKRLNVSTSFLAQWLPSMTYCTLNYYYRYTTTVLGPYVRDYPAEAIPKNKPFWILLKQR